MASMAGTVDLLGIPVSRLTVSQLAEKIHDLVVNKQKTIVSPINANCVNIALRDAEYMGILNSADIVYADGVSVVWAARLLGDSLLERIPSADLLPELCKIAVRKRYKLYFLGSEPGIARKAAQDLLKRFPGLWIVGWNKGYFKECEELSIIHKINTMKPDILFVGMGTPKQEKWIKQPIEERAASVIIPCGGLFDLYSGKIKRAPIWMRGLGFEWLYRLFSEPKRLWRRYLIGNWVFIFNVLR